VQPIPRRPNLGNLGCPLRVPAFQEQEPSVVLRLALLLIHGPAFDSAARANLHELHAARPAVIAQQILAATLQEENCACGYTQRKTLHSAFCFMNCSPDILPHTSEEVDIWLGTLQSQAPECQPE
jgi:hypothetical protein